MALTDFSIDTSGTPQDVQRRQKLAEALMQQGGDSSPAAGGKGGGWITALNRGLAGALGGYQQGQIRQDEMARNKANDAQMAALSSALMGGAQPPAAAPMGSVGTPPEAAPRPPRSPIVAALAEPDEAPTPPAPPPGADSGFPVFGPDGRMMGNQTGNIGQPPAGSAPAPQAAPERTPAATVADRFPQPVQAAGQNSQAVAAAWAVIRNPYASPAAKQIAGSIVTQSLTPKEVHTQETDKDGNVWDVDRLTGKKTVALKASEKNDPNAVKVLGRDGELYKIGPDGQPVILHKNQSDVGPGMSDEAIDFAAERAMAGDTKALVGLGRGNQGRETLVKINERIAQKAKEQGISAKGILDNVAQQAGLVSSSRALGTKETHFGVAEKAMEESLPIAQAASDAVPRTDWVHVNKLIQAGQTEHANPQLKRFLIATDTAAKDYARTINPTGALRESDIEYARKILSTSDGPEAYRQGLDQLRIEAGVMHRAIQRQKDELHGKKPAETTAAPTAPAKSGPQDGDVAHNPQTGETIIRKGGKWVPLS